MHILLEGVVGPKKRAPRRPAREWTCSLPSCGATFVRVPGAVKDPERVYCSQLCAKRAKSEAALPAAARPQVVERYLKGEQTGDLAREFGVSGYAIRAALRQHGVTPDRSRAGQASWARRSDVPPDEGDLETGFRWCSACRERKPMHEFYWASKRNGKALNRLRQCKRCRGSKRPTGTARRAIRRKHAYGLTQGAFEAMFADQDGRCAICRVEFEAEGARTVFVDHCHFDRAVRGLLCVRCNSGLGHFRDDPDLMRMAIKYIENGGHWHWEEAEVGRC